MKRLMIMALVIFGLLTVICVTAVVGRRWRSNAIPELHRCGGKICYFDIVIHETSLDRALTLLRRSPELKEMNPGGSDLIFVHSSPEYRIQLFASQDTVVGFDMGRFEQPFTVVDILSSLGQPCSVFSDFGSPGYLLLLYPDIGVYIQSTTDKMKPISPVYAIRTGGYDRDDCPSVAQLNHGTITGASHVWHGLGEFYGRH